MSRPPLLVVAFDACDPQIALDLAAAGRMPALAALLGRGATVRIDNPPGLFVGAIDFENQSFYSVGYCKVGFSFSWLYLLSFSRHSSAFVMQFCLYSVTNNISKLSSIISYSFFLQFQIPME